jgi:mannan endo-1,4-beta-mannosidase
MKKRLLFLCTLIAFMFLLLSSGQAVSAADSQYPGFRVEGRFLYDNQGEKVILYGINKMIVWTDKDGIPSYSEIAKTGANSVRIVWSLEGTAEELDIAIRNCRAENMIPIVELHDATGDWSKLSALVDYWTRPDIVAVIQKHQEYLLVNIGNEVGQQVSEADFKAGYKTAVNRMRTAGIHVPLVIDASSYGQDINMLQSCGPYLLTEDPDHNLMFSVHMWWPKAWGYTDQRVIDELEESVALNLPLIVGEFGHIWDETETGKIPYQTIIEYCYKYQIGYLPWEFGPGNNPQTFLDMSTDGTYDTLHGWGLEVAVTSPYSIQNIAERPVSMLSNLPALLPAEPLPAGNLALGRTVTVSSSESSLYSGNNITDGSLDTRWASGLSDPNWVSIDLGSVKDINRVLIYWEAAYATQYKIQVSADGTTWTDVYTQYGGKGRTEDISLTATGRYVRIYGTQRYNNSWPYSIYEVGIYGAESALSASISPAAAIFDKNPGKQADVAITLNSKANTLTAVKNNGSSLQAGIDYVVSGTALLIKKEYLAAQPVGIYRLTLAYNGGVDPVLAIAVGDTTPSPFIRPGRVDYNKTAGSQSDVVITLSAAGSLNSIKNGTSLLTAGTDYSLSGNQVTIKKEYLNRQSLGITRLTFDYNAKYNPVLKVNISDTSPSAVITPVTAVFEKRLPADITINMTLNGNTLTSILNNEAVLAAGTDYILTGNTITLKKEYLSTLPTGTTTLSFVFSAGASQLLTLSVTDTVPNSVITPDRAVFDKESPADIPIALTLNGNSLLGIYNGAALLISGSDYTLSGTAVILKKEYLSSLSEGTIRLLFDFSAGKDAELVITGTSAATGLSLTFYNGTKTAQANTLSLRLKLTNTGNEAIRLSDVSLHYYYTKDGSQSQSFWCDWSHVGSSNVTGNFIALTAPKTGADNYLEIGFASAAGSLAVNQSIEIQIRVAKADWSNYTQTNDYSFLESADSYVSWEKVTTYVEGILTSGLEP